MVEIRMRLNYKVSQSFTWSLLMVSACACSWCWAESTSRRQSVRARSFSATSCRSWATVSDSLLGLGDLGEIIIIRVIKMRFGNDRKYNGGKKRELEL